jgi:hypothetical protein
MLGPVSSAAAPPKRATFRSADRNAQLRKDEVVGLADTAARQKGLEPEHYQRSDPQFDTVDGTWLLFYDAGQMGTQAQKHFTVAVDDKTKRTAIVPSR